ncbi:FAD-binding domain-containing protein [Acephala macrosclerotiorum]|nr:FAD-binding domain-containing protein [Acephala macrosclerotiorum]
MASLSTSLRTVLDAPAASKFSTLAAQYKGTITATASALDSITTTSSDSSEVRAVNTTKALSILYDSRVSTPTSTSYSLAQQQNWSTTCWLPASSIIKLRNTIEVALALKIVTFMQCQFAVRGAGHNSNPGCSSIGKEGVLLDLSEMNEVVLSDDKEVASVGPGATWDGVYKALEKDEKTVVGGRASGVGVGGLVTGGGMSHFSNCWGMVCDNVKNFEVVLADSTIVQASSKENTDLFKVLKGGQLNFGIVTRFDLQTFSDYHVWYTFKVYSVADIKHVMDATVKVQQAMEKNNRIGLFLSINPGFLVAGMLYKGQVSGTPSAFNVFDEITPMTVPLPETQGTQFSVVMASTMAEKKKRETGTTSVRVDSTVYLDLHKKLQEIVADSPFTLVFTIQPIGPAAVEKGKAQGGNCMNIPSEPHSFIGAMVEWEDDKDDDAARVKVRELITVIEDTTRARGLLLDFKFMNDAGYIQSPLKSYGREMVEFLKGQSEKWDPNGVFQKLQNGGHLLSKLDAAV